MMKHSRRDAVRIKVKAMRYYRAVTPYPGRKWAIRHRNNADSESAFEQTIYILRILPRSIFILMDNSGISISSLISTFYMLKKL